MRNLRWVEICRAGEALHIARVQGSQNRCWRLHRHDFYECFFVESGSVGHCLPGSIERLGAGHLVLIRPEHVHGFKAGAEDFAMTNLAMRADVVESFLGRHGHPSGAWVAGAGPLVVELPPVRRSAFRALLHSVADGGRQALDADFFLSGLARSLLPRPASETNGSLPEWLRDALPLMGEPGNLREGLPALFRLCGRGHEHVCRVFTARLGQTPTDWVNGARIDLARRLLETTGLSVLEVALECGFASQSHFHRLFRAACATTPLAFRRRAASVQAG